MTEHESGWGYVNGKMVHVGSYMQGRHRGRLDRTALLNELDEPPTPEEFLYSENVLAAAGILRAEGQPGLAERVLWLDVQAEDAARRARNISEDARQTAHEMQKERDKTARLRDALIASGVKPGLVERIENGL